MRLCAVGLLAVATAAVAGCGATPALVRPSATPAPTTGVRAASVDPTGLNRGPDPRLSWYDAGTRTLHHGQRTTPVDLDGTVESVAVAGSSDLLVVTGADAQGRVVRLDPDGSTSVLARSRLAGSFVTVSADARTFAWVSGGPLRTAPVLVARVVDGHQVARRRFPNEQLRVLELSPGRALVSSFGRTAWWHLKADSVQVLLDDTAVAASPGGERLALRAERSGRSSVADAQAGSSGGSAWSLPRREVPVAFNPDGTLVLTGRDVEVDPRGYDVYQRPLRVRDAATGRERAVFDGRFGWYAAGSARWEDDDHLLAVARDPAYRSGDPILRRSWVRCSVTTRSCEAAGPLETAQLDVPPYGPLERLVAGPLVD